MNVSKIGIVIQARTGSTRFPKKVVKPFCQTKSILEIIVERLRGSEFDLPVIVATSDSTEDDEISRLAQLCGAKVFRGDEKNVLKRMIGAAEVHQLTHLVRVCADNVFLSNPYLDALLEEFYKDPGIDYLSYKNNFNTPVIKTHFGFFCEIASVKALKEVVNRTTDPFFLEHVTLFLYTHKELFNLKFLSIPNGIGSHSDLRFTIDTQDDFNLMQELYSIVKPDPNFDMRKLISLVTSNETYLKIMKKNIEFNSK